jgi:hypothetical protein
MRYVNSISGGGNSSKNNSEYTNLTETNKGTLGLKNGKWYNIKTGKIAQ